MVADTNENTLITAAGSSNIIVGSIVVCNTDATSNINITLSLYDLSETQQTYITKNEVILTEFSREILARPFVLETGDEIRIQSNVANVANVIVSYMDRNRD